LSYGLRGGDKLCIVGEPIVGNTQNGSNGEAGEKGGAALPTLEELYVQYSPFDTIDGQLIFYGEVNNHIHGSNGKALVLTFIGVLQKRSPPDVAVNDWPSTEVKRGPISVVFNF